MRESNALQGSRQEDEIQLVLLSDREGNFGLRVGSISWLFPRVPVAWRRPICMVHVSVFLRGGCCMSTQLTQIAKGLFVLVLVFQRQIVSGLTQGAVKG